MNHIKGVQFCLYYRLQYVYGSALKSMGAMCADAIWKSLPIKIIKSIYFPHDHITSCHYGYGYSTDLSGFVLFSISFILLLVVSLQRQLVKQQKPMIKPG